MTDRKPVNLLELAVIIICVAAAAYFLAPRIGRSQDARRDRAVKENAVAINIALQDFSAKNRGSFPLTEKVFGGESKDALISGSVLLRYPRNPYSNSGERMKNVPKNSQSPGNFSYFRNPLIGNDYTLIAYGKNGIVYKYHKDILK